MLTEIAFQAKRHWGYPERWIETWRSSLTVEPAFIMKHETYSAFIGTNIVGFHALCCRGQHLLLEHLWVRPDAMGRGVGRSLFTHAIGLAGSLGFTVVQIESDPNAEGFYLRMGASRAGTNTVESDGIKRELPILHYQIGHSMKSKAAESRNRAE